MKQGRAWWVFAATLLLLGIALLVWGMWPVKRMTQVLRVAPSGLDWPRIPAESGAFEPVAKEQADYSLMLEYPEVIRVGDSELVRLRISHLSSADGSTDSRADLADGSRTTSGDRVEAPIAFQARLELAGAIARPEGDITAVWSADRPTGFLWIIRGERGSTAQGTAWTFLIPASSSDLTQERSALAAQPLEIKKASLLGLTGAGARVLGAFLVTLAAVLGMPRLDGALRRAIRQ